MVDGVARETWVFRASGLGGCDSALVRAGRGEVGRSAPGWMLERYQEGHDFEALILTRYGLGLAGHRRGPVHARNWRMMDGQYEIEFPVGDHTVIRGHLDGIYTVVNARGDDHRLIGEAKFLGPDMYAKYLRDGITAFPYYEMQLSIYMHALRLPAAFIVGQKVIHEVDGQREVTLGEVTYDLIHEPPIALGQIKARVARLVSLIESGREVECNTRAFPCPYYAVEGTLCNGSDANKHDKNSNPEISTVEGEDAAELLAAVEMYQRGAEQAKAGEKLKKEWGPRVTALVERLSRKGGQVRVGRVPQANTCSADGVTPSEDDGGFLVVTDHVEQREARVVEYRAGEVRYPRIKVEKSKQNKGDG